MAGENPTHVETIPAAGEVERVFGCHPNVTSDRAVGRAATAGSGVPALSLVDETCVHKSAEGLATKNHKNAQKVAGVVWG
jgi:hypothetical protein